MILNPQATILLDDYVSAIICREFSEKRKDFGLHVVESWKTARKAFVRLTSTEEQC